MSNKFPLVFFKTIFYLIPEPILILQKHDLKIRLSNLEFQNLFQKSNEYLTGKKLKEIIRKESIFLDNLNLVIKKNGLFIIKDKIKVNSSFFEIECLVSDELSDNFVLIFKKIDFHDDKFTENNLNFFNETFSILSHEVNNPISSIKLASDLIKKKFKNVDVDLLNIIKSEALRITNLFHNFNLSDLKYLKKKTNENIHELIRISLFKIKQMPNQLNLIESFDPSLPLIKINRDAIIQVLDNLLINAYESSNFFKDSYLKIETKFLIGESIKIPNILNNVKKNSICIVISENGKGIKQEIEEKIFLPFFSTKRRGSGVGLFLVKKIINDHEGTVNIKSVDGVTRGQIVLPL